MRWNRLFSALRGDKPNSDREMLEGMIRAREVEDVRFNEKMRELIARYPRPLQAAADCFGPDSLGREVGLSDLGLAINSVIMLANRHSHFHELKETCEIRLHRHGSISFEGLVASIPVATVSAEIMYVLMSENKTLASLDARTFVDHWQNQLVVNVIWTWICDAVAVNPRFLHEFDTLVHEDAEERWLNNSAVFRVVA